MRQWIVLAVTLSGCGSSGASSSPDMASSPNDAFAGDLANTCNETSFSTQPFDVLAGDDNTWCTFVQADNLDAFDVNVLRGEQGAGGHHLIVYFVDHPIPTHSEPCSQGGQPGWSQVYATQSPSEKVSLPADVGLHVGKHQQLVLETHFINATKQKTTVQSRFSVCRAAAGVVKQLAAPYYFGTMNITAPANQSAKAMVDCQVPANIQLYNVFGHQHSLGTHVVFDPGVNPSNVYQSTSWSDPPITKYDAGLMLPAGQHVHVECEWNNTTNKEVSYPTEMCYAVGLYWPATKGTLFCVSAGGSSDCKCLPQGVTSSGPGGTTVTLKVGIEKTFLDSYPQAGVGKPIYCELWSSKDFTGMSTPTLGTYPLYQGDAQGTVLKNDMARATVVFNDVTPGKYVPLCFMDTVNGGFVPGSGDPVSLFDGMKPIDTTMNASVMTEVSLLATIP